MLPAGDGSDASFSSMYHELRAMAHARLRRNEPITLLNTTSLVHETWLRFMQAGRSGFESRGQFMAYAAQAMRSIIVDFVRQRRAERHGGGQQRVTLDTAVPDSRLGPDDEVLRVHEALEELAKADERLVRLVEMRYFAGLGDEDIAASLEISSRTVRRDWQKARLLLSLAMR